MKKIFAILVFAVCIAFLAGTALATPPGKTVEFAGGDAGKVTFDGKSHASAGQKCNNCHPKTFKMKKGANTITMKDINAGNSCGTCHNGTDAFDAKKSCNKCHKK